MTIAISLKINDGVVLAADSASTLMAPAPAGPQIVSVYNNANKVFNLKKGLPIGAITWGQGAIGYASTSTLMKDLRRRFDSDDASWRIDPNDYTVEGVAIKLRKFFFDELYVPEYGNFQGKKPAIGFCVAGYSSGAQLASEFSIQIDEAGNCVAPVAIRAESESGLHFGGEPQAIVRLVMGFDPSLAETLAPRLNVAPQQVQQALTASLPTLAAQLVQAAMPIQDAIDLAEFLVELTKNYSRFRPGAPTVGGPAEIAAITKHEGFKWVKRKHYFGNELNPPHTP